MQDWLNKPAKTDRLGTMHGNRWLIVPIILLLSSCATASYDEAIVADYGKTPAAIETAVEAVAEPDIIPAEEHEAANEPSAELVAEVPEAVAEAEAVEESPAEEPAEINDAEELPVIEEAIEVPEIAVEEEMPGIAAEEEAPLPEVIAEEQAYSIEPWLFRLMVSSVAIVLLFTLATAIRNIYHMPLPRVISIVLSFVFTVFPAVISSLAAGWSGEWLLYLILLTSYFIFRSKGTRRFR